MESDKPDLNSILESARAQLEMYRRVSQEDLTEPTKEIILARSKDQVMEDVSGPLIDRAKETAAAGVECVSTASCKSVGDENQNAEELKVEKDSRANSEMEEEGVEVEGEESSNKNFDSSTMTLGDQQSFQNQAELTSQTTYTNIHELTGPVKDDILVVTGPKTEASDVTDPPSAVSDESQSDTTTVNLTTTSMTTPTIEDLNKVEDVPQNQMASNRSWKSDPCRESHQETIVTETFPQEKTWDEAVDKGDAMQLAGAGTREGSPVRTSARLIQEVAHRLSQLDVEGNRCRLKQNFNDEGADCPRENNNVASEESGSKNFESKQEVVGKGCSDFDNTPKQQNFMTFPTSMENKQIDFVEHFDERLMNRNDTGEGRLSDKSMLEDEGFIDSRDLLDSTKIIFISDQEDEQSCKPFETEDDTSCMLELSSTGRSLDLLSDLEAKPSLTDVHPIDQSKLCENYGEADAESNRLMSLEMLQPSPNHDQNVVDQEINYNLENVNHASITEDSQLIGGPKEPAEANSLQDTFKMTVKIAPLSSKKSQNITNRTNKDEADKQLSPEPKANENKSDSNKRKERVKEEVKSHSPTQGSCSPRAVQSHNKSAGSSHEPTQKKQNICIGRALFEMFHKSISEGKSPLPPHLTKILQDAYASELPPATCSTSVPLTKHRTSSADKDSACKSSDQGSNNPSAAGKSPLGKSPPTVKSENVNESQIPKITKPISTSVPPPNPRLNVTSDNLQESCDLIIRPSLPITPLDQLESNISIQFPQIPNESKSGLLLVNSPSSSNDTNLVKDAAISSDKSKVPKNIKETEKDMNSPNHKHNETKPQPKIIELPKKLIDMENLESSKLQELSCMNKITSEININIRSQFDFQVNNKKPVSTVPLSDLDNLLTEFLGIPRDTQETVISEIDGQEITDIKNDLKDDIQDSSSMPSKGGFDGKPGDSVLANKEEGHSTGEEIHVSPQVNGSSEIASNKNYFCTIKDDNQRTSKRTTEEHNPLECDYSDVSSLQTSSESFSTRPYIPLQYSSDLSDRGERPLTPYVSDIRGPLPDINQYLQDTRSPAPVAPTSLVPQIHAQTTRQTTIDSVNPGVAVKSPPRPPPRARQQVRPKRKKINFFKKLFGIKTKSSN